jgi:hypothetical protein
MRGVLKGGRVSKIPAYLGIENQSMFSKGRCHTPRLSIKFLENILNIF